MNATMLTSIRTLITATAITLAGCELYIDRSSDNGNNNIANVLADAGVIYDDGGYFGCQSDYDCGQACYCEIDASGYGSCLESDYCTFDADCAALGMTCDEDRGTCIPDETPPCGDGDGDGGSWSDGDGGSWSDGDGGGWSDGDGGLDFPDAGP